MKIVKYFGYTTVIVAISMFAFSSFSFSGEKEEYEYIGVKKCSMCHKGEKAGGQYEQWTKTLHAKAYETLATPQAKEIGKKLGIEDPQKSEKCLKCHVTGYGAKGKIVLEHGVQCESCHGAGKAYAIEKVMKNLEESKAKGLIMPTEEVCKQCHNKQSPTFKALNFKESYEKIKHLRPKK